VIYKCVGGDGDDEVEEDERADDDVNQHQYRSDNLHPPLRILINTQPTPGQPTGLGLAHSQTTPTLILRHHSTNESVA